VSLSVAERARHIATFRFVEVRLMEIAAAWTPTAPEMELKVLLGRHIWDFAQHADALGKRTFELRQPAQHSLRPAEAYVRLLEDVAALSGSGERLAALYGVVLRGLEQRYERYLRETDPVLDGPSVVILERILEDSRRQRNEADGLAGELALVPAPPDPLPARDAGLPEILAP